MLAVLAVTFLVFASVSAALTCMVRFLHTVTGISGGRRGSFTAFVAVIAIPAAWAPAS